MNSKKNMLIMIGNPGTGKTYFCSGFINDTWGKYESIRYWPEKKLFERLRQTIDQKGDYEKELEYMIDDELVIFDDIGSSGLTEWRKEILFNAIDLRYSSMKPTIITSNLTRKEIRENLHDRFCDRLFASENTIIEMNTPSLRQENL
jgi:DNA replication protein DnaC